jgi:TonB family protein
MRAAMSFSWLCLLDGKRHERLSFAIIGCPLSGQPNRTGQHNSLPRRKNLELSRQAPSEPKPRPHAARIAACLLDNFANTLGARQLSAMNMKPDFRKRIGVLGFAMLAGCATQPARVPPALADALARQGVGPVDNFNYVDEQGRPMTEREFVAQVAQSRQFAVTRAHDDGERDVTLRLRPLDYDAGQKNSAVPVASLNPAERPAMIDFKTCGRPVYPPDELRAKHTGTVKLNFLIGTDGAVKKAEIGTSSGYPALDQVALATLSRCRFTPGTSAGAPAEKWSPVHYQWSIE